MTKSVDYVIAAFQSGYVNEKELFNLINELENNSHLDILDILKKKVSAEHIEKIEKEIMTEKRSNRNSVKNSLLSPGGDKIVLKSIDGAESLILKSIGGDIELDERGFSSDIKQNRTSAIEKEKRDVDSEQYGKYILTEEKDKGGMGRVLVAFDDHIKREIAIKELLSSNSKNSRMIIRFLREARITGRLEHPSIVPVYEIGKRTDGTFYYAMKLVKGKTLDAAIKECKTPEERLKLLPHFRDLCNAIAFAHSKNIIHRDIKPENVMIGEFGETVVLDWGLSKVKGDVEFLEENVEKLEQFDGSDEFSENELVILKNNIDQLIEEDKRHTIFGAAMGTPSYMPPEQALGEIDQIDELSDIYSLGAVLYEILSGDPPYKGDTVYGIISNVINEPLMLLEKLENPPPKELAAVTEKALRKKKEDRYSSAIDLAKEIEAYMSGEKVSVYEYSSLEILSMFMKRNMALVVAIFAVFIILIIAVIGIFSQYRNAEKALLNEREARVKERKAVRESKYHYAQGLLNKGVDMMKINNHNAAAIYAAASIKNNPAHENSDYYSEKFATSHFESVYFEAAANSLLYWNRFGPKVNLSRIMEHDDRVWDVVFSPDGSKIVSGSSDKTVKLWDAETGKILKSFEGHLNSVRDVDFSPDGSKVVSVSRDRTIKFWNVENGKMLNSIVIGNNIAAWCVTFSPDGKKIVSGNSDNSVKVWDVRSGKLLKTVVGHKNSVRSVAVSPDGTKIISGSRDSTIKVWDMKSGKELNTFKNHKDSVVSVNFSPDGGKIVSGSYDGTAKISDLQTGKVLKTLKDHKDAIWSVNFSPDGKEVLSGSFDNTIRLWDLETGKTLKVFDHKASVYSAAFSKDGNSIVSGSSGKTIKLWKLNREAAFITLKGHKDRIWYATFSPDGSKAVSCSNDGVIKLWDIKTGKAIKTFEEKKAVFSLAFSKDGKRVLSGGGDFTAKLWDLETGQIVQNFKGHKDSIVSVLFSPDGGRALTGSYDKTIKLWSVETGKILQTFKGHKNAVLRAIFLQKGDSILSGSYDKTVKLWDVKTGQEIKSFEHPDYIVGIAVSENEKNIYATCKDGNVYKWNVKNSKIVKIYKGHRAWVNFIKLSPDKKFILTSADDRTIRVWDEKSGKELLIAPTKEGASIDWSPDGNSFLFGDSKNINIWPFDPKILSRNPKDILSEAELDAGIKLRGFILEQMTKKEFEKRKQ